MKTIKRTASKKTASTPVKVPRLSRSTSLHVNGIGSGDEIDVPNVPLPATRRSPDQATTIIEAKIDVGFGNQLFIRGQGPGLGWERGELLTCIDSQTWRWTTNSDETIEFKLLLNDEVWCQGLNIEAVPGAKIEVVPIF